MVGYKDHKTYGDSSIYENTPSDNTKFYLELQGLIMIGRLDPEEIQMDDSLRKRKETRPSV